MNSVQPTGLNKIGTKEFKVTWSDGHASLYSFRYLRQHCQCALCVDEWSGKPLLLRESVSQDLEGLSVKLVGQYAIQIQFSDGHNTGIYTFEHLRKICPCENCKALADTAAGEDKKFLDKEDLRKRS